MVRSPKAGTGEGRAEMALKMKQNSMIKENLRMERPPGSKGVGAATIGNSGFNI